MKNTTSPFLPFLLSLVLSFVSCSSDHSVPAQEFRMVVVHNVSAAFNLNRSGVHFGSFSAEDGTTALIAADGDLLILMMEDETMFFRYRESDGNLLDFTADILAKHAYYAEDQLISLSLTDDSAVWSWIQTADKELFKSLRSLYINLPLSQAQAAQLGSITEMCPEAGLVVEGDENLEWIMPALQVCRPEWLYLMDLYIPQWQKDFIPLLKQVELFGLEAEDLAWMEAQAMAPELRSLILKGWHPQRSGNDYLPNAGMLKSLTIIESGITDLKLINQAGGLVSLHLVQCDTLSDIGMLKGYNELVSLGFSFCPNIRDLKSVGSIRSLKWLSLPENTTPENLSWVAQAFPRLEVIELIGCEEIRDLTPLADMNRLRGIVLDVPAGDLSPLTLLDKLELLILEEDIYGDSVEGISQLREKLPGIMVYPGGGLCLGSGWIFLLIPLVLGLRRVFRRRMYDGNP